MTVPDLSKLRDWEYPETAKRFYQETKDHELTILLDTKEGYRHLRMMNPKESSYWYEIVTWLGNLVFRGDGASFVFSIFGQDMLKFFRSGLYKDGSIHINPGYWSEKLSSDREVRSYEQDKFEAWVEEYLKEYEEIYPGLLEDWKGKTDGFMAEYDLSHEHGSYEALNNYTYGESHTARCSCGKSSVEERHEYDARSWARKNGHLKSNGLPTPGHTVEIKRRSPFFFEMSDLSNHSFQDFDWWFLWACYGILRAIQMYDAVKAEEKKLSGEVEPA